MQRMAGPRRAGTQRISLISNAARRMRTPLTASLPTKMKIASLGEASRNAGKKERGEVVTASKSSGRNSKQLADALPGLVAAEQAAEGAALDAEQVRTLHRDDGVVVVAARGIVDAAGPFAVVGRRLHVDQDALIAALAKAAEIGAALFDAHIALVVLGLPQADRRGRGDGRRRGSGLLLRRLLHGLSLWRRRRGRSRRHGRRRGIGDRSRRPIGRRGAGRTRSRRQLGQALARPLGSGRGRRRRGVVCNRRRGRCGVRNRRCGRSRRCRRRRIRDRGRRGRRLDGGRSRSGRRGRRRVVCDLVIAVRLVALHAFAVAGDAEARQRIAVARRLDADLLAVDLEREAAGLSGGRCQQQRRGGGEIERLLHLCLQRQLEWDERCVKPYAAAAAPSVTRLTGGRGRA